MNVNLTFGDDKDLAELAGAVRQVLRDQLEAMEQLPEDDPWNDPMIRRLQRLHVRINNARLRLLRQSRIKSVA